MELLDRDTLKTLLQPHEPPCASLYLPTHRNHPSNQQDPIRFKNLVTKVEESLRQKYRNKDARAFVEPLRKLEADASFWNHTLDGLAVLISDKGMRVFQVQRPFKELAVVADTFHTKPLLRIVQSADQFHVLGVSRQTARFWVGNRDVLDEVILPGFPGNSKAVLGDQLTEPMVSARSGGTGSIFHGQGSRKDEIDKDTERYFRAVDRATTDLISKHSGVPLILVALAENQSAFRSVSHNGALLAQGIHHNPESLDVKQLKDEAWGLFQQEYLARLARLTEAFGAAAAHQKGTGDLSDAARAAVEGRVATLLVDADKVLPGRIDMNTGAISSGVLSDPEVGDLLDDLGEIVLKTGGDVVIVPHDRMPTSTGLAAIYRF